MILTADQYGVLEKIAKNTGMDCWFCIQQDSSGDYVYDLEEGKRMSIREGIRLLAEGYQPCGLSEAEIRVFEELISRRA